MTAYFPTIKGYRYWLQIEILIYSGYNDFSKLVKKYPNYPPLPWWERAG
jgi:hypothetical protein